MAGVLQLSAVSIGAKHREWRSNEGCGHNGIFRAALNFKVTRKRVLWYYSVGQAGM